MMQKYCFEALNKTLRDILCFDIPNSVELAFRGKCIVFSCDFCQILPVVLRGTRFDIVHAYLNASYLWSHCKMLTLTKSMRLQSTFDVQ